jgi:hypothetical protein
MTHVQLSYRALGEPMTLPTKLLLPKPDGRSQGSFLDLGKVPQVARGYCELMGIDPDTQLPTRKELERLGMNDVANMLEGLGEGPEKEA